MDRFANYIERILAHEGGLVDHPSDPGGLTNWGIAQRSYPALNIRALTRADAIAIYRRDFWERIGGPGLPEAFAFQVLDAAVNHGIGNALRWMQEAAGVAPDGHIGPVTRRALSEANQDDLILRFNATRLEFYTKLSTFQHFGRGWVRRVAADLRHAAQDN
jgi:lysozyme family protein